ncbi:hypothetical protein CKAH01_15787 [Colletotrichum kahawae]|uniref:Uncharacterized protein n=1 Tax=Colletotrichum kahawae TaxID=34407 RepID=A0AAD9YHQ5_COLKA|nr:hypothetical protein CKAH01_15787 [Colletotrichum kahawae]
MMNPGGRSLEDLSSYNYASGGPLGSLNLLWRLRFWHYASLGAVITLVAFASGPFFRQSVTSELRSVIDPAFSPSANAVAAYSWGEGILGWSYVQYAFQSLPYNMTAAILAGLFAPDQTSPPKPPSNCPTGNCTWESFGTLSVNSKCIDISSRVEKRLNGTEYQLEAPSDPLLQGILTVSDKYHIFFLASYVPAILNISYVPQTFLNLTAALAIVDWVKVWPEDPSVDSSITYEMLSQNSRIEAFRCAFYFSAKEVLPRVENGVYSEEVLQEVTRPENAQFLNEQAGARKYFGHIQDSWPPLEYRLPGLPPNRKNNFTVGRLAFIPIYSQMMRDLTGQVSFGSRDISKTTTPLLLYKADSVRQSMQNMADSITNEIRRNGSSVNPDQTIQGHVWIQQQFVVVRWAWLALPATKLLLTSLFLAATIVETRRKDVGVWLSSPLALFFNGHLDSSGKDILSNASSKSLNTADGMVQVAAGLKASIVKGSRTISVVAYQPLKAQDEDIEMRSLREFDAIDTSVRDNKTHFTGDVHRKRA